MRYFSIQVRPICCVARMFTRPDCAFAISGPGISSEETSIGMTARGKLATQEPPANGPTPVCVPCYRSSNLGAVLIEELGNPLGVDRSDVECHIRLHSWRNGTPIDRTRCRNRAARANGPRTNDPGCTFQNPMYQLIAEVAIEQPDDVVQKLGEGERSSNDEFFDGPLDRLKAPLEQGCRTFHLPHFLGA